MKITFDPAKRASTLKDRGLDFADAVEVFAGKTPDIPDERRDYGEPRIITVGSLRERMAISTSSSRWLATVSINAAVSP